MDRKTRGEDWPRVLERLLAGDRAAFLRFNRLLTGFLRRLRAYDFDDEWDDLRQEVLAAVVANARAGRLRDPGAFVGYVRVITRNKFMDRLERRIRTGERQHLAWRDEALGSATPVASEPVPPELRRDLARALAELDERDRGLVEGVYVEGRSYDEMARASGLPLGTLKRRLRTSLARLRARLAAAPPEAAGPRRAGAAPGDPVAAKPETPST